MSDVVLITGAAMGLGSALASIFFENGYNVVMTDVDYDGVVAAAESLDKRGERVLAMRLDVTRKSDFVQALKATTAKFGRCDVLINNAAMTPTTPVMEIEQEEFDQVIAINLRGTLFGCQVFGQYFLDQEYGRIINMASLAGQMGGTASGAHYAASKGGIITLTKLFARQFAAAGVTVNAIAPGPVDVPSIREKVPADKLEEIINTMIPTKKMTEPDFIAQMAILLASKNSASVTGACWDTNGGIFMR